MWTFSAGSAVKKIKLFHGPGTRQWPRIHSADLPSLTVLSGAGFEIPVVNISQGGALLRTRSKLAPGTKIPLHFWVGSDGISLSAFVLRCSVSSTKRLPRYETAVVFNRALPILDGGPQASAAASKGVVMKSPPFGLFAGSEEISCERTPDEVSPIIAAFLALDICIEQDPALIAMRQVNRW
jgi:hypothetical protein